MTIDGTFESGITGWTLTSCTFVQSTTFAHGGTHSGKMSAIGTPASSMPESTMAMPVVEGTMYTLTMWIYSVAGCSNFEADLNWRDGSGTQVDSDFTAVTIPAATWTPVVVQAVAPAGAVGATFAPALDSPLSLQIIYVDDVVFAPVDVTVHEDTAWPPRLTIAVTGLSPGNAVTVYRVVAGQRTAIRSASGLTITDPSVIVVDAEFPFGTPMAYLVNVDGVDTTTSGLTEVTDFEDGSVAVWSILSACTLTSSSTHAHTGTLAGLLTVVGSPTQAYIRTNVDVVAGRPLSMSLWLYSAAGLTGQAQASIDFFDADGGYLSTTTNGPLVDLAAATWTQIGLSTTVPAGAVTGHYGPTLGSSPPTSTAVWVDDVRLLTAAPTLVELPGGKVALSDAITGLAVEVVVSAWPTKSRTRAGTQFPVGGRIIAVLAPRGSFTSTIECLTDTDVAREQMDALLDSLTEGIVLLRQAGGYNGADGYYYVIGDAEDRAAQSGKFPRRIWPLNVISSEPWASGIEAHASDYADLEAAYTGLTYVDLENDFMGGTYVDLAVYDWTDA